MITRSASLAGIIFALTGFGLFATHDAIIKSIGGEVGVAQIIFFSTLFAFPWVSVMVLSDGAEANFRPRHPIMLVFRTLAGLISAACAFYAFLHIPLAEVYGLLFTSPLIITLLSVPMLGERIGIARISAVLMGFAGVLIMLPLGMSALSLGHLAALGAAFFGALNGVLTRKIGADEREVVMIMMPMGISLLIVAMILPMSYTPLSMHNFYALMIIGCIGFFGQLCMILAYKRSDAGVIAPMQYSQLIWALIYGSLFFGETVVTRQLIGAGIIIASGLIILYRERKGANSRNQPSSNFRNVRPGMFRTFVSGRDKG